MAELWYNTYFHSCIQKTPNEIIYCQPSPVHLPYLAGDSVIAVVDRSLVQRENMITTLKFHLRRAHQRIKLEVDTQRTEREFEIGDWVLLKLQK